MKSNERNFKSLTKTHAFAALTVLFIFWGCSKKDDSSSSITSDFPSIYSKLLKVSCFNCHSSGSSSGGVTDLDFSSELQAWNDLMGTVKGPTTISTCASVRRVNPGDPNTSYLMALLSSSFGSNNFAGVTGCTPPTSTHLGNVSLKQSEIDAIATWIRNGATRQ